MPLALPDRLPLKRMGLPAEQDGQHPRVVQRGTLSGEQRYGSVGAGLRWKYVAADAAYLLAGESSPLHDTWMLTILCSW